MKFKSADDRRLDGKLKQNEVMGGKKSLILDRNRTTEDCWTGLALFGAESLCSGYFASTEDEKAF